jgi:hypothetical protein
MLANTKPDEVGIFVYIIYIILTIFLLSILALFINFYGPCMLELLNKIPISEPTPSYKVYGIPDRYGNYHRTISEYQYKDLSRFEQNRYREYWT